MLCCHFSGVAADINASGAELVYAAALAVYFFSGDGWLSSLMDLSRMSPTELQLILP